MCVSARNLRPMLLRQPLPQALPPALAKDLGIGLPASGRDGVAEDAHACSSGLITMI